MIRPTFTIKSPNRVSLSVWGLAISSWAVLIAWTNSLYSVYLRHSQLGGVSSPAGFLSLSTFFLVGWLLMVVAMMLPTTLPLLNEFRRRVTADGEDARGVALPLLAGYIGLWTLIGITAYLMDLGVHRVAELPALRENLWLLGLASPALAGAYQFTAAKVNATRACCYPGDFIGSRWKSGYSGPAIFRLGLGYGKADIGSHWALMLLMFSLGLGSVLWMLVMGMAMAAEKNSRLSHTTRVVIGATLLGMAAYVIASNSF